MQRILIHLCNTHVFLLIICSLKSLLIASFISQKVNYCILFTYIYIFKPFHKAKKLILNNEDLLSPLGCISIIIESATYTSLLIKVYIQNLRHIEVWDLCFLFLHSQNFPLKNCMLIFSELTPCSSSREKQSTELLDRRNWYTTQGKVYSTLNRLF